MKLRARILPSLATIAVAVGMMMAATGSANAAPATHTNQVRAQAGVTTVMKDCYNYGGVQRGCSYFNPADNYFRVCDVFADNPPRYTRGRVSLNGVVWWDVGPTYENTCTPAFYVPAQAGDLVCIHTGVEGLGWTTPECRRL